MRGFRHSGGLGVLVGAAALLSGCVSDPAAPAAPRPQEVIGLSCPDMRIAFGGQALTIYDRAGETDPSRVRYQASVLEISRVCFRTGDLLTVDIELSGRIVAGPRGTGGTASAPLVVTVVQDGGVTVLQRAYTVSANIGPPVYGGDYTVADTIAMPLGTDPITVTIIVGFDQN